MIWESLNNIKIALTDTEGGGTEGGEAAIQSNNPVYEFEIRDQFYKRKEGWSKNQMKHIYIIKQD